jgi:hypothetical protein
MRDGHRGERLPYLGRKEVIYDHTDSYTASISKSGRGSPFSKAYLSSRGEGNPRVGS